MSSDEVSEVDDHDEQIVDDVVVIHSEYQGMKILQILTG